jgi:formylglycine-generating enzyme required for sulfatase activity
MARVEKTVFISYRRKDISWALAVYQYLSGKNYDVFFDFSSIPSGDFEQIIVSNIRARAHFVLILTPTALDRASEPGDWLRREIETALAEKRNIIPLFLEGFSFGSPSVARRLTGRLADIQRYNGLDIPSGYFLEAMERLSERYLNVPLDAVIHPVSTEVCKVVKQEQVAVNEALAQRWGEIRELFKPAKVNSSDSSSNLSGNKQFNSRRFGIGAGILLLATLGIFGIRSLMSNVLGPENRTPTSPVEFVTTPTMSEAIPTQTGAVVTDTETPMPPTSTATATSTPAIGSTRIAPRDGMVQLYVPAGEFIMGNDDVADEKPSHSVELDAFWIDQTEVTNAMYAMCVRVDACNEPSITLHYSDPSYSKHPVVYVSWNDAMTYCSWVERKLPTEAEWEKAARGKNARTYPWGNDSPDETLLNYSGTSFADTTEVGIFPNGASAYGALDMAGNVWEWTTSLFQEYPYSETDGREDLSVSGTRVVRGGAWVDPAYSVRSSNRAGVEPVPSYELGFRCAMDASP